MPLTPPEAIVYANGVIKKLEDDFGGATFSRLPETQEERSPFSGTWMMELDQARPAYLAYAEQIFFLVVDIDLKDNRAKTDFDGRNMQVTTRDDLVRYLKTFKNQAQGVLRQQLVWVTVHDIDQII